MLTKQHRYSFRSGLPKKTLNTSLFVLRYQKSERFSCAIVVSKKVSPLAVKRNNLKRLYKDILKNLNQTHKLEYSFVFYLRKNNRDLQPEIIHNAVEHSLKKEGII